MTSRPLTYEVSKNILQYLSLEKRIELAISCPGVRTAERKAELYLDYLHLNDRFLTVNDVTYRANSLKYRGEPDKCSLQIDQGPREISSRNLAIKLEDVWKKLFNFWLGDRGIVKVNVLEVTNGYQGVCLPNNLKMECKELKLSSSTTSLEKPEEHQLKTFQLIRQSLTDTPLRKLTIFAYNAPDPIFQQDLVRTANLLKIIKDSHRSKSIVSDLVQLTNQRIHVKSAHYCFAKEDVVTLARSWLEQCPTIGTQFTLHLGSACPEYVREVLKLISSITEMRSDDELHIFEEHPYLVMEVRKSLHRSFAKLSFKD